MKKGFTIIEVSILFVIFLIVAFLVAPLSLDDTMQAKNTSRWRNVQEDFINIHSSVTSLVEEENVDFIETLKEAFENEVKSSIKPYKITYMNGTSSAKDFKYEEFYVTYSNAVLAYKFFEPTENELLGELIYDVNGVNGPNVWGKDVYGMNIYKNKFEPLGYDRAFDTQKRTSGKSDIVCPWNKIVRSKIYGF